jgi:hypothetical protein
MTTPFERRLAQAEQAIMPRTDLSGCSREALIDRLLEIYREQCTNPDESQSIVRTPGQCCGCPGIGRCARGAPRLPPAHRAAHAPPMFCISEADAAAIRAIFHERGEFSAAVELRRLFPGIGDTEQARECARTIAGWRPLPRRPRPVKRLGGKTE